MVSEQLHSHCWCPRVFLSVSLPLSEEEFHKTFPPWNMKFQGRWQDSNKAEQSLMDHNKKGFSLFPLGAPHAPERRGTLKKPPRFLYGKRDLWHLGANHWAWTDINAWSYLFLKLCTAGNAMCESQHSWEGGRFAEYLLEVIYRSSFLLDSTHP